MRVLSIYCSVFFTFAAHFSCMCYAENKVILGGKNLLFGWFELPKKIMVKTRETRNPAFGLIAGTFQGALKAIITTSSGICDIVSAPAEPDAERPFK